MLEYSASSSQSINQTVNAKEHWISQLYDETATFPK